MISIIIPTYNSINTLGKTIESIVSQTFLEYEILIIDGKSLDGTIELIENYCNTNNKIKYISESDKGIYDAMNKGIALAKGNWVYFLGSDDYLYHSDVLKNVNNVIEENLYDIVYGNVFNQTIQGKYDGEFNFEKICRDGICHQSIFYKKSILQNLGGYDISMKAYAHIYLDKILFANKDVKWRYIDEIIASYASDGFSKTYFDVAYWNKAEKLLLDNFSDKVSKKIIYESLFPIIKYQFSFNSFILTLKAIFFCKSLKPFNLWLQHPMAMPRLIFKKFSSKN